jgi:hypothetical protein
MAGGKRERSRRNKIKRGFLGEWGYVARSDRQAIAARQDEAYMSSSWLLPTLLVAFKVVVVHDPYLVLFSIIKVGFPPH